MRNDPSTVLSNARENFRAQDYESALENYRWFYENSLSVDKSYYGVRLSFCLGEWADLGQAYPPAKIALNSLKETVLSEFKTSRSMEAFHEFASICDALLCPIETYQEFILIQDKEISAQLFKFIHEYCASNGMWDICREYIGDGLQQYQQNLEIFDHMHSFANQKTGDSRESLIKGAKEMFRREVSWRLAMLLHVNAHAEYEIAITKLETDLKIRGCDEVFHEIIGKSN